MLFRSLVPPVFQGPDGTDLTKQQADAISILGNRQIQQRTWLGIDPSSPAGKGALGGYSSLPASMQATNDSQYQAMTDPRQALTDKIAADKKRVNDAQAKMLGALTPDEELHCTAIILAQGDMTMYYECKTIMQNKDPSAGNMRATLAEAIAARPVAPTSIAKVPAANDQEPSTAADREGKDENGGLM